MFLELMSKALSPEDLRQVGLVAALLLVTGVLVWLTGVKIARPGVALATAGGGFALGYFLLPKMADVPALTAGFIGLAVGLALGVIAFRFLQALVVAALAAVAAGGVYYAQNIAPNAPSTAPQAQPASGWTGLAAEVIRQYHAIATQDAQRLAIVACGIGFVALLFALGFPKLTTLVGTAAAGATAMLLAAGVLLHFYAPGQANLLPAEARHQGLVLGVLVAIGVVVQYRFFLFRADKSSKTTGQAVPVTSLRPV